MRPIRNIEDMKVLAITHQGLVRENNEDRFLMKRHDNDAVLLAVADGMGGHVGGEEAARIATRSLNDFNPNSQDVKAHFIELVEASHRNIQASTAEKPALKGMGTTLTVVFLDKGTAHWAHIGDTRLYLLRKGQLIRVTRDHTIPGLLLHQGEITASEARLHPLRNMLLRCIGCGNTEADTGSFELKEGDLILLSSDGLHDMVPEETIEVILNSKINLKEKLKELVSAALNVGGRDNITAVAAEV